MQGAEHVISVFFFFFLITSFCRWLTDSWIRVATIIAKNMAEAQLAKLHQIMFYMFQLTHQRFFLIDLNSLAPENPTNMLYSRC